MGIAWVERSARSLRHHRGWVLAMICFTAIGVMVGLEATRRPRPSLEFPPVDPNTGCGPVSLALAGHWLDVHRTIDELNHLARSYDTGVSSLHDLKEAAKAIGLAAEAVRLDPARPIPWRWPTILYLRGNHFTATLPIDGDRLVFADPPQPPVVLDRRRLVGDWEGIALVIAPTPADISRALSDGGLLAARP